MNGTTANPTSVETAEDSYEDAVSQAGIDVGEFVIELVKNNPSMRLSVDTLKDVLSSTLASLTLYIEDPDSPFRDEKED